MWATDTVAPEPSRWQVRLLRDANLVAVVSLDDWWVSSATRHIIDEAFQLEGIDFKANEIYGPDETTARLWTTNLVPTSEGFDVHLLRDGATAAIISLGDWAQLSATTWAMENAREAVEGLLELGNNIEEVKEALKDEEGFEDEADLRKSDR
jgi:hypothetical protein